jgi:hypothetical protein
MRRVAILAGFVWTLPNTVIGLVLGMCTFQLPRLERGLVLFDRAPRGLSKILRRMGRAAMTVGFVVIGTGRVRGRLLDHELHHVRQYCVLGPLFLPVYGALFARYGYARHPMEVAAERAAIRASTLPAR